MSTEKQRKSKVRPLKSISKIGNYVNDNIQIEEKRKKVQKREKVEQIREVVHQIFKNCASVTEDDYWRDILTEMSYGKFPKGFSFFNGVLKYTKSPKKKFEIILDNNPMISLEEIKNFMRHGNMYSDKDKENNVKESNKTVLNWLSMSKKTRAICIIEYVYEKSRELSYNKEEREKLLELVNDTINNYIDAKKIVLEKRRLVSIPGLIFENGSFKRDPELKPKNAQNKSSKRQNIKNTKYRNIQAWDLLIKRIEKKSDSDEGALSRMISSKVTDTEATGTDSHL